MKIQHEELKGRSSFSYCRQAMGSGASPDEKLEIYRGDTLAYTISSIKWGADHMLIEEDKRGFRIRKFKPFVKFKETK